ncbi:hypothetical protein EVA_06539 [gut metagenome]|uniref:Uncharacterized protein n=1 Tax=gut metagenome TaxID=749906 RepID=J9GEN0_9ZZZZ
MNARTTSDARLCAFFSKKDADNGLGAVWPPFWAS